MPSIHNKFSPSQAKLASSAFSRPLLVLLSTLLLCGAALAQRPDGPSGGRHDNKGDNHESRDNRDNRDNHGKGGKHSQGSDRPGPEMHGTDRRGSDRPSQDRQVQDRQGSLRVEIRTGAYFQDQQRSAVHDYYGTQYRAGRCPPGLARKNNGCRPPGQTRPYSVGQRLAPAVIYHSVPSAMVISLGVPPSGHRYVRIASDILLIAIGSGMVIDAIQDLGGL